MAMNLRRLTDWVEWEWAMHLAALDLGLVTGDFSTHRWRYESRTPESALLTHLLNELLSLGFLEEHPEEMKLRWRADYQPTRAADVQPAEAAEGAGEVVAPQPPPPVWLDYTEHHPEPGWPLEAFDLDKEAARTFSLPDVHALSTRPPAAGEGLEALVQRRGKLLGIEGPDVAEFADLLGREGHFSRPRADGLSFLPDGSGEWLALVEPVAVTTEGDTVRVKTSLGNTFTFLIREGPDAPAA